MTGAIDLDRYRGGFRSLEFATPDDGVLEVVIANEGRLNAATEAMHRDLALVWRDIDVDDAVQYASAKSLRAKAIISLDRDFDDLDIPRMDPGAFTP